MAEIMGVSRTVSPQSESPQSEPLSWLRRIFLVLAGRRPRDGRARRIDERAWSGYMIRDIGLDEGRGMRSRDPRDISSGWPLR